MSLNQSLNISLGSMKNNQYALTVVAQNISNLNTPGYHRQRVDFVTNQYTTDCENVISTIKGMNGASIAALTDYMDSAAFHDAINSNADAQYYNTLADALKGLEDISNELGDDGLNAILNDFYKAAANLEQFPTDMAIRQQYVLSAQNVCDKFNEISKRYDNLLDSTIDSVDNNVNTINALFEKLASANKAHIKNNCGPATQSEIDSILEELSNYMDVTTTKNENGSYNLYVGSFAVVQGADVNFNLTAKYNRNDPDNTISFGLQSTKDENFKVTEGITETFKTGSMKAYLDFVNGSGGRYYNINDMKSALDTAAKAFGDKLNEIQTWDNGNTFAAYIVQNGSELELKKASDTQTKMFTTSDGSADITASNIQVNIDIIKDPFKVSAARIDLSKYTPQEIANEDWKKAIGNSDNASMIIAVQNEKICNGLTLSQFLVGNAAKNGMDVASIDSKAGTYQNIADNAMNNYINLVGVNLDEELADMIKYQRAYEASAKLFSTINNLIGTIIGMV